MKRFLLWISTDDIRAENERLRRRNSDLERILANTKMDKLEISMKKQEFAQTIVWQKGRITTLKRKLGQYEGGKS